MSTRSFLGFSSVVLVLLTLMGGTKPSSIVETKHNLSVSGKGLALAFPPPACLACARVNRSPEGSPMVGEAFSVALHLIRACVGRFFA